MLYHMSCPDDNCDGELAFDNVDGPDPEVGLFGYSMAYCPDDSVHADECDHKNWTTKQIEALEYKMSERMSDPNEWGDDY